MKVFSPMWLHMWIFRWPTLIFLLSQSVKVIGCGTQHSHSSSPIKSPQHDSGCESWDDQIWHFCSHTFYMINWTHGFGNLERLVGGVHIPEITDWVSLGNSTRIERKTCINHALFSRHINPLCAEPWYMAIRYIWH